MPTITIEHAYAVGDSVFVVGSYYSEVHRCYIRYPASRTVDGISIEYCTNPTEKTTITYSLNDGTKARERDLFQSARKCRESIERNEK